MSKGQFVRLPYELLDSPEWRNLSASARDVYISMRRMKYRRTSRGEIHCTSWDRIPFGYSDVLVSMSKSTFVRAIMELRSAKLIKLVEVGSFPNKKAVYALMRYRK